jgi:hypothetical protein
MGKKMQVSVALRGKVSSHGLTAMDDDDDVLTALARELVTEKGIGEGAAAVWKSPQRSNTFACASTPQTAATEPESTLFQADDWRRLGQRLANLAAARASLESIT